MERVLIALVLGVSGFGVAAQQVPKAAVEKRPPTYTTKSAPMAAPPLAAGAAGAPDQTAELLRAQTAMLKSLLEKVDAMEQRLDRIEQGRR